MDWLIGGSTNFTGNLKTYLNFETNGNPKVSWTPNISNRVYNVEANTNLVDGAGWQGLETVTNDAGYVVDTNAVSGAKFYRVGVCLRD